MILAGDVPVDQLQTLAFEVDAAGLAELRSGLRVAVEALDAAPLRGFATFRLPRYSQTLTRARWRVAPEVVREVLDGVVVVLDAVERGDVRLAFDHEPGAVRRDVDRWRRRARDQEPLLLRPGAWLGLARSVRFHVPRGGDALSRYIGVLSSMWPYELADLEGADEPSLHLDDYDPEPHLRRLGHSQDGADLPELSCALQLDALAELLVGPFVVSQGPGPFADVPRAARPLCDPWWAEGRPWLASEASTAAPWIRFLADADAIDDAIAELRSTTPDRRWVSAWFERVGEREWGEHLASHALVDAGGWSSWSHVVERDWERCQARTLALYERARAHGRAILFAYSLPDDQGTRVAPLMCDLGERVLLDL